MPTHRLDIVGDAVCPWCCIGKWRLGEALGLLGDTGRRLAVRWLPYEPNPDLPQGGMDRREHRIREFGGLARPQARDAQAAAVADAAGLAVRPELIARVPNTFDAHRPIRLGEGEGVQDAVVEGLSRAYLADGPDVGLAAVLADIGVAAGMRPERVPGFLAGAEGAAEVRAAEARARQAGVQGVPGFLVDGRFLFSGAHAAAMAEHLHRAV